METLVNPKYTKEDIIQRIVFTIAKKWQINEKEVASRFDPLMMLLVEVIAQELDNINSQWELSVGEMTDTIIQKFFPKYPVKENLPHTTILQAKPLEATAILQDSFNFQLNQAEQTTNFTAICSTKIFNLSLHSLWVNNQPFSGSAGFQNKQQQVVRRLGLLCEKAGDLDNIDGLQIYISTGNVAEKEMLLYAIQHGQCFVNGEPTECIIGYEKNNIKGSEYWDSLQNIASAIYQSKFVTIKKKDRIKSIGEHEILSYLSDKDKKSLDTGNLVYIQWDFPVQLQERWLNQLSLHLNAFVAINRTHHNVQHKLDQFVNLIPLTIDEHLLFVDAVKGDTNDAYKLLEYATEEQLTDGHFVLKSSAFGKMNSHSLRYSIQELKQQVNSSNAFYANVPNDYIGRQLKEMQRLAYRLEDKMQTAKPLKQQLQFLLVKPFRSDKFLSVDYWTFNNHQIEKVRLDTVLETKGSVVDKSGALIIAKPYPLAVKYRDTLNQPLQQIVSENDINTLAANVFGEQLLKVDIQRAYQSGKNVHEPKRLTISINIYTKAGYDKDYAELDTNRVLYELKRYSIISYPFSVHIIYQ